MPPMAAHRIMCSLTAVSGPSDSGGPGTRPVGGVSGPFRPWRRRRVRAGSTSAGSAGVAGTRARRSWPDPRHHLTDDLAQTPRQRGRPSLRAPQVEMLAGPPVLMDSGGATPSTLLDDVFSNALPIRCPGRAPRRTVSRVSWNFGDDPSELYAAAPTVSVGAAVSGWACRYSAE